ncbi:hypothetical protein SAMN05444920_104367 [Nonomuraea solani]|uniref:Uncharacterized protein n=2 Tax=Nonomuraea solani TaxID=1144553 RepID=A0A1H6CTH8_9ACTN|nr:hypothetical protein SAMN05444920_104367 [Nonomuraea solani]
MSKLGLNVDSLQIQEIEDATGYITNLGRPHAAAVAALARIAEAQRDQEANAAEQEAVVAQQLAERWPEIVEAGAKAFGNVDHMVVLNGAQGVEEMLAKALTLGGAGPGLAKALLNGETPSKTTESEIIPEAPELRE